MLHERSPKYSGGQDILTPILLDVEAHNSESAAGRNIDARCLHDDACKGFSISLDYN